MGGLRLSDGRLTDAFDVAGETKATQESYGTGTVGRQLLITRRLIERGVRFVQVWSGGGQPWDNHNKLKENHGKLAADWDRAIGTLSVRRGSPGEQQRGEPDPETTRAVEDRPDEGQISQEARQEEDEHDESDQSEHSAILAACTSHLLVGAMTRQRLEP